MLLVELLVHSYCAVFSFHILVIWSVDMDMDMI